MLQKTPKLGCVLLRSVAPIKGIKRHSIVLRRTNAALAAFRLTSKRGF